MTHGEDSLRDLESHHHQLQDLHNTLQETLLMMQEENLTYEYELNDYQALQTLADEMEIEETMRQAEDIRQVKREVQFQIASYVANT
ncbi:hypothetical protein EON65_17015 [archaeon]|nr:MAG: hypothetical protein EON65_17015 [archaeon]